MAIIVNGQTWRYLTDPLYVNGNKVYAAYANSQKVYPEKLTAGTYIVKIRGWNSVAKTEVYPMGQRCFSVGNASWGGKNKRAYYEWIKGIHDEHFASHTIADHGGQVRGDYRAQAAFACTLQVTIDDDAFDDVYSPGTLKLQSSGDAYLARDELYDAYWMIFHAQCRADPLRNYSLMCGLAIPATSMTMIEYKTYVRNISLSVPGPILTWQNPSGSAYDTATILEPDRISLHNLVAERSVEITKRYIVSSGTGIRTFSGFNYSKPVITGNCEFDSVYLETEGKRKLIAMIDSAFILQRASVKRHIVTRSWPPKIEEDTMDLNKYGAAPMLAAIPIKEIVYIEKLREDLSLEQIHVSEMDIRWG